MTRLVLAHRGACWELPENTLEAFELAIAERADYVEFDVRARGEELVICHDPDPPRDAPGLDEVLDALTGRVGLAVEVKEEETTGAVLAAIEHHGVAPDDVLMLSFRRRALEEIRHLRPELRCVLHAPDPAAASGFWGVGFEEPTEAGALRQAQSLGLATTVFTVNEPARMLELANLGVTGLFTDRPALARETLQAVR